MSASVALYGLVLVAMIDDGLRGGSGEAGSWGVMAAATLRRDWARIERSTQVTHNDDGLSLNVS